MPGGSTPDAPDAPSNLYAVLANADGQGPIDLVWDNNPNNEATYIIESSTDGTNFTAFDGLKTSADKTDFSVPPPENTGWILGMTYYFRVKATNDGGESSYSNIDSVSLPRISPICTTGVAASGTAGTPGPSLTSTTLDFAAGGTLSGGSLYPVEGGGTGGVDPVADIPDSVGSGGAGLGLRQGPVIAQLSYGDHPSYTVVFSPGNQRYFDWDAGAERYVEDFGGTGSLGSDVGSFAMTNAGGDAWTFGSDFRATLAGPIADFESRSDAGGNSAQVYSRDGDGRVTEVRIVNSASVATESWLYAYISGGVNDGLLETVTQYEKDGAGWKKTHTLEYTYYDGTSDAGLPRQVRTATVIDDEGTVDSAYYRYYKGVGTLLGSAGGVKFSLGDASYRRALEYYDVSSGDDLSDGQLEDFADVYTEYDDDYRIKTRRVQGDGCSTCTGGQGTYSYTYEFSENSDGVNSWHYKTTETLPDGNTNYTYYNYRGQVMLSVFVDTASGQKWGTFHEYDAAGREVMTASPSAVALPNSLSTIEAYPSLLNGSGGTYQYISDSAGKVDITEYYASTTATDSTPGGAVGYVQNRKVKQGDGGTAILLSNTTYIAREADDVTIYVVKANTVYRNTDGSGGQTTTYDYEWYSSTLRASQITTTYAAVTTAQNGSNASTSEIDILDTFGRVTWHKDADGYVTYNSYDSVTGGLTQTIVDVNTASVSDEPSGWTTPSGGGLHLTTNYEVDDQGRAVKVTDPSGNVTYTVYDDAAHEVRTYRGWDATAKLPTEPVEVMRDDRDKGYAETLTYSYTGVGGLPVDGDGKPTGGESLTSGSVVIQSLSRSILNKSGQVVEGVQYTNFNSTSYSQSTVKFGTAGANYLLTEYGYDNRGRLARVKAPDGTWTHVVYDGLGRVVSKWVGINNTGWTHTDPSNGGAGGNNMLKVLQNIYDSAGVGDGNLTESRAVFSNGGSDSYASAYQYDFRDRLTYMRGPDKVAEKYAFDNLGQTTQIDKFADADTDGVIDSTELRGRTQYEFDERGQTLRDKVTEVDPMTGTASDTLATNYWYDARGNLIKSSTANGLFGKSAFDGAGRLVATYTSYDSTEFSSPTYAAADDVSGDKVIEQTKTIYDKGSRPVVQTTYKTKSGSPSTGELAANNSFIQTTVLRYDRADRLTDTIQFGRDNGTRRYVFRSDGAIADGLDLNGDNDYVDVGEVAGDGDGIPYFADVDRDGDGIQYEAGDATLDPNTSDDYIVGRTEYDAAGRAYRSIDNKGHIAETTFDLLGRQTKLVENYVNGTATETETDTDRTTTWIYDAQGRLSKMTAKNPKGSGNGVEDQVTQYLYTSEIDRSWSTLTAYPDTSSGPGTAKSVSSLTQTGGLATVTSTAHGFTAGDIVLIEGATPGGYNGWFTVLSATTNTFTYNVGDSSLASATGTITAKKWTGTDQTSSTFDRLGRTVTSTDQRGVVHTFTYDSAGRLTADSATTIPSGVDGAVKRIGYTYDDLSRQQKITSYPNADGSGTIVNEVKLSYDGWGNVSKSEQSHSGAVVPGTTPAVSYTYEDGASSGVAKYVRLATVTYPDGRPIAYIYPNSGDSYVLSRADIVDDQSTDTMAEYTWVGADLVVAINHPDVTGGLVLDYGTASDYDGFDRFGRIISQKWRNNSGSTNFDLFTYTYDRNSNRLTKDVGSVNGTSGHDEAYTYDGLDRLASFQRGTITSGTIGSVNYSQSWNTLDSLGNWQQFTEDTNGSTSGGSTTYDRTHNKANETTDSGSTWIDPAYDAAGNMTTAPKTGAETTALYYFYDAWNRLVGISLNNDGDFTDTNEWRYSYDGLNRRIIKDRAGNSTADDEFYLSEKDQVLQSYRGGNAAAYQTNVWDVRYVDSPIAVYRDWNFDGTPNDKHWLITDANYNVTALVGRDGLVKERYEYNPYGERMVLDADFSADADNATDWANDYGHQGLRHDAETGLIYNRARYLHPTLGLFVQRDPGGYLDGPNLYQVEAGNPVNELDPSGLFRGIPYAPNWMNEAMAWQSSNPNVLWWSTFINTFLAEAEKNLDCWSQCMKERIALAISLGTGLPIVPFIPTPKWTIKPLLGAARYRQYVGTTPMAWVVTNVGALAGGNRWIRNVRLQRMLFSWKELQKLQYIPRNAKNFASWGDVGGFYGYRMLRGGLAAVSILSIHCSLKCACAATHQSR